MNLITCLIRLLTSILIRYIMFMTLISKLLMI
nr:MAG TPA: hypothetical protein [Crassvirales sp.]